MIDVTPITAKTALVRSKLPGAGFVINPYLGCAHGCRYCYAVFMRKYSRHHQQAPWGSFVEPKINVAAVLEQELRRKKAPASAFLASVCDPYQPLEARYRLTRGCLELLRDYGWGIDLLTRSPLVLRDMEVIAATARHSIGLSIPTDDDAVRRVLEPDAPPIGARLATLKKLHDAGLSPWVFIAPALPLNPEQLAAAIGPYARHVLLDALNYRQQVRALFQAQGWDYALTDEYFAATAQKLGQLLGNKLRQV
jgi:DNA repair photolyase